MRNPGATPGRHRSQCLAILFAISTVAWAAACGDGGEPVGPPPEPPNRAPTVASSIAAQTVTVGESVTVNVVSAFSDPDGDPLSYTASTSPAGVASVSVSGSTLTITGVAAGTATITVTATDPGGLSASLEAAVTVTQANRAPVTTIGSIPPQSGETGGTLTLDLGPYFEDPDGDALTFGAETSDAAIATASVEGSTLTVALVGAGMATVTATATDPGGLSASLEAAVTVTRANRAPVTTIGSIPPQSGETGGTLTLDLGPYFEDPDGDALTFGAETSDAAIATASVEGSTLTVALVGAGMATVTATATDPGGLSASLEAAVTVTRANRAPVTTIGSIPPQSGETGGTLTLDLGPYFEDPDGDALTFGAETSDAAIATASVEGSTLTVALVGAGMVTVTATATDPGGLSASLEAAVTVTQANRAPVTTIGSIPPQSGETGGTLTLDLGPYFEDPDGDALTFGAETSDAAIATASVEGSTLTVALVGAGMATVTATATDPGGLSASLEAAVTVTQANRAPVTTIGSIPPQSGETGGTLTLDLGPYFEDPDGDALTFGAETSDAAIATASVEGSTLTVALVGAGMATVTATATDPGGLSASLEAAVTVTGPGTSQTVFRDNFDDDRSLSNWQIRYGSHTISAGILRLTTVEEFTPVFADRELGSEYTSWEASAKLAREQVERARVHVAFHTGDQRYPLYGLFIGSGHFRGSQPVNYEFYIWDEQLFQGAGNWMVIPGAYGNSEAIHDAAGEFTEVTVTLVDGRLRLDAGTTQLIELQLDASYPANIVGIRLSSFSFDVGKTSLFDWVEVKGVPASSSANVDGQGS